jgi:polyisoprenoid-binding protein YceI
MENTLVKTKWGIDVAHSEVQFKIKHLVISTVTGKFNQFSGSVETENDDFTNASITFSLDVNSIDTNNTDRDNHLKSDDFFAADKYPHITFNSTSFEKVADNKYLLSGDITIREVTKNINLDVEFGGKMIDPWGNEKAGFEINGIINRKDFGLNWSAVTEAGGLVVSDEVRLHINVEIAKEA